MRRKSRNVKFDRMHPDIWPKLFLLDEWWRKNTGYELIFTSARSGRHSTTSDHYWGGAVDIRTWTDAHSGIQIAGEARTELFKAFKSYMGPDWFCLDEGHHFHVSYRPRQP